MKTMQDFELRCTEEQTRKAFKLGAPIETYMSEFRHPFEHYIEDNGVQYNIPTTQQMIGWIREKGIHIEIGQSDGGHYYYLLKYQHTQVCQWNSYDDYPQAELAAIDAALDYMKNSVYYLDNMIKCADSILSNLEKEV